MPSLLDPHNTVTGLTVLKDGRDIPNLGSTCSTFITDTWWNRSHSLKCYFPVNRIFSNAIIKKLEGIRRTRVKVAHYFGTDAIDLSSPVQFKKDLVPMSLHEHNLKDCLNLFHRLAEQIDNIMLADIHDFELQILWHTRDITKYPRQSYLEENCAMMRRLITQSYNVPSFRRRQLEPILREYESVL